MKKLKVGITGSTGSLGKELIKQNKCSYIKFTGDVRSRHHVRVWFVKNRFDAVIHLVAIVPIKKVNENKKKALKVNFNGTKYIVNEIYKHKINWFFFASTSHVYNSSKKKISENYKLNPISYYGKTKKLAEEYIIKKLKNTNVKYCIGRIFSTTNKSQKKNYLVPDLKYKIKKAKKKITLDNLNHYRDFISIEDISEIIIVLLKKRFKGILNLGSGKGIFLKDIAKIIGKKYNKKVIFNNNKITTYLIANINRLLKNYKFKKSKKIENLIF